MAQGFQLARGQGATLGNPEAVQQAQAQQQQNLAEMMSRYQAAKGQGDFGDALMGTQYVQNSGALGALAQALSMGIGGRVKRLADEKASEWSGRVFAEQQRVTQEQAAAERAQAEADAARERQRIESQRRAEAEAMGLAGPKAAEYVATGKVPKVPDAVVTLETLANRPDLAAID